ncbi:MAG: sarcosine oxidase subunit delta [Pseudomonadota bacterium]
MMQINCPFCGPRDHSEFTYVDVAMVYPALDASEKEWFDAVFLRDNPKGRVFELWQHTLGCRSLLILERDTLTHEIFSVRLAHPGMQATLEEVA